MVQPCRCTRSNVDGTGKFPTLSPSMPALCGGHTTCTINQAGACSTAAQPDAHHAHNTHGGHAHDTTVATTALQSHTGSNATIKCANNSTKVTARNLLQTPHLLTQRMLLLALLLLVDNQRLSRLVTKYPSQQFTTTLYKVGVPARIELPDNP